MNQTKFKDLYSIFKIEFADGLDKFPDEEDDLHHILIISGKVYLIYDGYGIHKGAKGCLHGLHWAAGSRCVLRKKGGTHTAIYRFHTLG